jgi:hypothetical protein
VRPQERIPAIDHQRGDGDLETDPDPRVSTLVAAGYGAHRRRIKPPQLDQLRRLQCPHRGHASTCPRRRHHHKSTVSSRSAGAASSQTPAGAPTLPPTPRIALASKENDMIVLGLVLLVVGFLLHISILTTLGIILLVIGAVLAILGGTGRMVGGRRHWY